MVCSISNGKFQNPVNEVINSCMTSIQYAESGVSGVVGQPGLHRKFKFSLD
jgi:hypothetical protein